ncbi:MAG: arginine repressor [Thermoleophilia bacterium]
MNRRERHEAILRLIAEQPVSTQTELAEALRDRGHDVVQTTVSRDVGELGLVKVRDADGHLVYAPPGAADPDRLRTLAVAVRQWARSFETAGPLVVIRTPPGAANALAQAIDAVDHPAVAGTVAGDDTIFVAPRDGYTAAALRDELTEGLMEGAA